MKQKNTGINRCTKSTPCKIFYLRYVLGVLLYLQRFGYVYLRPAFVFTAVFVSFLIPLLYTQGSGQVAKAAATSNINFQARLLTNNGALVPDGTYNVEFKLYDSAAAGSSAQGSCSLSSGADDCWWIETRTGANQATVKNGYLSANLGAVTAFGANIPWDQELWLTMNIGGTGTPSWNGEMSPRIKLTALPYAFRAAEANQLKTISGANSSTLSIVAPTGGNQVFQIQDQGAAGTYNLCIQNSASCGYALLSAANTFAGLNTFSAAGTALQVTNNAIIGGTLTVNGAATLSSTLAVTGLITGNAGLTITGAATSISGGAINLNASSNNNTNINTGTSTGTVTVGGNAAIFKNTNDSTTAFQIQGAAGFSGLVVDTTGGNIIANGNFETNITGWAANGATTLAQNCANAQFNSCSLAVTTPTTAGTGTKISSFTTALVNNTEYVFSGYIKGSSAGSFTMGIARNGSTETNCTTFDNVGTSDSTFTTTFVRYNCVFDTSTLSGTPYIYINQSDTTARTIYIDGAVLKKGTYNDSEQWSDSNLTLNGFQSINGALTVNTTGSWNAKPIRIVNSNVGEAAWFDGNGDLFLNTFLQTRNTSSSSTSSNALYVNTGDATGSSSNSGDIIIRTGSATGTRGNVILGSTSASAMFTNIQANKTGYALTVSNASTATSAGAPGSSASGILIDLGTTNANRTTGNYFVAFGGAGTVDGKIQGGSGSAVAYTTTGADYAEYFRADPSNLPQAGQIVMADTANSHSVVKSNGIPDKLLVGIVSTSPGFIGNGPSCPVADTNCDLNYSKNNALVALSGQVPVKVNAQSGPIAIGDPITASTTPGEGAKAITAGYIVGYAQEPLSSGSGTIKVLVRPQHYTPSIQQILQPVSLNVTGDTQLQGNTQAANLAVAGLATLASLSVSGSATFTGNVVVTNSLTTATLTVNGHIITGGSVPTVTPDSSISSALNITAVVDGNDTAGTITITTPPNLATPVLNTKLFSVTFTKAFSAKPKVITTAEGPESASLNTYVESTADNFKLGIINSLQPGKTYIINYFVVQ